MEGDKRFNVRVYGIMIVDGRLLVNDELIKGRRIIKLPGGGLEYGEGTIDCLKREWIEELDIAIDIVSHFYTTDYFQPSAFGESQVISIYYVVRPLEPITSIINKIEEEKTDWLPIDQIGSDTFTLPIDRVVGGMLQQRFNSGDFPL